MLFRLTNSSKGKGSHAGVLEFVAEEGRVYLPQWVNKKNDKKDYAFCDNK